MTEVMSKAFEELSEDEQVKRITEVHEQIKALREGRISEAQDSSCISAGPRLEQVLATAQRTGYMVYEVQGPSPNIVFVSGSCHEIPDTKWRHYAMGVNTLLAERVITPWDTFIVEGIDHEITPTKTALDTIARTQHFIAPLIRYITEALTEYKVPLHGSDWPALIERQELAWRLAANFRREGREWPHDKDLRHEVLTAYIAMAERSRNYWAPFLARCSDEAQGNKLVYMTLRIEPVVFGEVTATLREQGKGYVTLVPQAGSPIA